MLRLHDAGETNFDGGCTAYLGDAYDVKIDKRINDIESLYFSYPYTDEKAAMIEENMVLSCEGQGYVALKVTRKTKGSDIVSVTATDLFSTYGKAKHIQNIPDMIGVLPSKVFERILQGTEFTMFTEAELQERGMTWIDNTGPNGGKYYIDFFSTDKTSVWDATLTLIENCGKGEIYRDNMKVAIVKQIGQDNGVRLTLEKNMEGVEIMRDFEGVITRLYPYGADDMHIGSVNGGKQYIDSPMIEKYGVYEGHKDYSDYTDPNKIKAHALWEFDPENENRIDVPAINITGGFIELFKLPEVGDIEKVDIGDTVRVYDNDHNMYKQRIVAYTTYPYEPKPPTIEIGHMETNFFNILYNLCQKRNELDAAQTANKSIATRKMQGVVNTDRNGVQSDNELLKIIGDLLTIYQEKSSKSKVKRLELGNVGGKFALNIYDETGKKLKIKLGDHGDKYAFAIYDNDGKPAIFMDEKGDVIFSGIVQGGKIESDTDINVTKDATVGRRIILQDKNEATAGYEEAAIISVSQGVMQILANNNRSINLHTDGNVNLNGKSVMVNNVEIATQEDLETMKNEIKQLWQAINNN